ncbi:IS21-like element helper ATPase IstB [Elizabethkingia anophelis]|uniref:ATP-binding protein n=1 Tax=Elizabethkingia anophelis TaxID=1117645 RepID=A0AAU8UZ53_9FLAO|nr:IS21-like element helper ATPase IstB [Elizabethkingia anophelis]AQX00501.1 ATP-binding protein [Elizabethkingia anophelis]AQX01465.1 ATP-binding protein [Elizabethkingia anophelis]AQX02197.1 ATP-binding protein [Elizabethkingia anophelis]AQX02203.1 ATP-binding protein [Elizabethkingia anophelis]AQX02222.1 ATP-binding protein [Elizabethkingia anophelis]
MEQLRNELTKLKLTGMAQCLKTMEETRSIYELSFKDGMELMLQSEKDQRETNRYNRLIKNAAFRYHVYMEELHFDTARGLEQSKVLSLATGGYLRHGEAILITGAAGCGKSFLASALGNQACRQGYSVAYFNMQKLMLRLKMARAEGIILRMFEKLAKTDLIIIDDFGMAAMDQQLQLDFMEIIEDRHARKATIIVSQLPVNNWFDIFEDQTLADALIDRIIHTSYRFELKGESLRKKV